jgi:hypothetical protein
MTAAEHIDAVRLTLPAHGRRQARSTSSRGRRRTEPVNLAADATTN